MVFTGDIEPPGVESMLEIGKAGEVDILKVPHHGSKNGLTSEMLNIFKPNSAIISSGMTNQWGHPNKETLDILGATGTKIYRTDQMGEITIVTDGQSYQVIP
jgi:competence protein ComEC